MRELRATPAPADAVVPRVRVGDLDGARESAGRGRVYSWIVSHHPTQPDAAPRIVVLVELEEGVRLVSNLHGIDPVDVRNDMPVEVCFVAFDGVVLPQFGPSSPTVPRGGG